MTWNKLLPMHGLGEGFIHEIRLHAVSVCSTKMCLASLTAVDHWPDASSAWYTSHSSGPKGKQDSECERLEEHAGIHKQRVLDCFQA